MGRAGLEPAVFLMSLIYSQLPSPLGHLPVASYVDRRAPGTEEGYPASVVYSYGIPPPSVQELVVRRLDRSAPRAPPTDWVRVSLERVAARARANDVRPLVPTTATLRDHVVARHLRHRDRALAVGAPTVVAIEEGLVLKLDALLDRLGVGSRYHRGPPHDVSRREYAPVVLEDDAARVVAHASHRVFCRYSVKGEGADRHVVRVQD